MGAQTGVYIYANGLDGHMLRVLAAGIEEEGVLCETLELDADNAGTLAKAAIAEAADFDADTRGSGAEIRLLGKDGVVLAVYNGSEEEFRNLGSNAARYINKKPLKL